MIAPTKRIYVFAVITAIFVVMIAYTFHSVKPDETGRLMFRAMMFSGGLSATVGFLAGFLARKR
ncbi:hypothetical protein P245_20815 [Comamonas thiooxydans]|uniref:Uncharacterized protein n=1 Tax=Comamonas thiooxydans TaxID=363952 RepID=A0A0E3B9P9_9BURK|nr:hypothetical protein [Comamonas thiooxydans]KGG86162.1 hypothetical protein P245_20815 [Comamonas thiooxydans]